MTEDRHISDAYSCENCFNLSWNMKQTEEGDWICPDCQKKHTCYECGKLWLDITTHIIDGELKRVCFDCKKLHVEDQAGFMETFASKLLGI